MTTISQQDFQNFRHAMQLLGIHMQYSKTPVLLDPTQSGPYKKDEAFDFYTVDDTSAAIQFGIDRDRDRSGDVSRLLWELKERGIVSIKERKVQVTYPEETEGDGWYTTPHTGRTITEAAYGEVVSLNIDKLPELLSQAQAYHDRAVQEKEERRARRKQAPDGYSASMPFNEAQARQLGDAEYDVSIAAEGEDAQKAQDTLVALKDQLAEEAQTLARDKFKKAKTDHDFNTKFKAVVETTRRGLHSAINEWLRDASYMAEDGLQESTGAKAALAATLMNDFDLDAPIVLPESLQNFGANDLFTTKMTALVGLLKDWRVQESATEHPDAIPTDKVIAAALKQELADAGRSLGQNVWPTTRRFLSELQQAQPKSEVASRA